MIEMELNKIIIDEKRHDQIIVLKEKKGERLLPIVIGFQEASSIKMRLSGVNPPRPLTHDLLHSVIEHLESRLEKIVIDKIENNTFHAKLFLTGENGKTKVIDARPSDSIALSVRAKAPIFVEEEVLKQSSSLK
jgi:bifunctional DNase/RNase